MEFSPIGAESSLIAGKPVGASQPACKTASAATLWLSDCRCVPIRTVSLSAILQQGHQQLAGAILEKVRVGLGLGSQ